MSALRDIVLFGLTIASLCLGAYRLGYSAGNTDGWKQTTALIEAISAARKAVGEVSQ